MKIKNFNWSIISRCLYFSYFMTFSLNFISFWGMIHQYTRHWVLSFICHANMIPKWPIFYSLKSKVHVKSMYKFNYMMLAISKLKMFVTSLCLNPKLDTYQSRLEKKFDTHQISRIYFLIYSSFVDFIFCFVVFLCRVLIIKIIVMQNSFPFLINTLK